VEIWNKIMRHEIRKDNSNIKNIEEKECSGIQFMDFSERYEFELVLFYLLAKGPLVCHLNSLKLFP
jgi:hypothetical protein